MAERPPSGTVTFLLTDLEGSTRMWEQDPEAMKAAMVRHDELLEKAITAHQGFIFFADGWRDGRAFATAGNAVFAASAFQRTLSDEPWRTDRPLRARVGLHTDEAVVVNDNYVSQPVNRCSRLMAAAHGGQIVISGATESLVRDELPEGMELTDLGDHRLRDLGRPVRVFQLSPVDHRKSFPPLRSLDSFPGNLPAQASSAAPAVSAPASPEANFVLAALRETGDIVAAALGEERRSELRTRGAAMTMDEAISYALAHIDPKVLSGPMGR